MDILPSSIPLELVQAILQNSLSFAINVFWELAEVLHY